ncbi:MAG: hypothetical protein HC866_03775 [Leptolyngbyaceae cyanobacterium RU_5_1]|nr:hypothetical protein [Leptolyngbyaceae cyanobacterium RU_5_1]
MLRQYVEQVMVLSMDCPEVHRTMLEIYHMVKPPVAFFQPNIAAKVLSQAWQKQMHKRKGCGDWARSNIRDRNLSSIS